MTTYFKSIEYYLEELSNDEKALIKINKYLEKLYNQKRKEKFLKEIQERIESINRETAEYIPADEVWKKYGI